MHKDDTIAPEIRVRDLHVRPCQAHRGQPDFQLTGQRRVARDLAAGGDTPLRCTGLELKSATFIDWGQH